MGEFIELNALWFNYTYSSAPSPSGLVQSPCGSEGELQYGGWAHMSQQSRSTHHNGKEARDTAADSTLRASKLGSSKSPKRAFRCKVSSTTRSRSCYADFTRISFTDRPRRSRQHPTSCFQHSFHLVMLSARSCATNDIRTTKIYCVCSYMSRVS